jgi:hypothetical protein
MNVMILMFSSWQITKLVSVAANVAFQEFLFTFS